MSITARLAHFSVPTRIYAGFLMICLFLAAVAALGYVTLADIDQRSEAYIRMTNQEQAIAKIRSDVLQMRRHTIRYIDHADKERLAKAKQLAASLLQDTTAVVAQLSPGRQETGNELLNTITRYVTNIDSIGALRSHYEKTTDQLKEANGAGTRLSSCLTTLRDDLLDNFETARLTTVLKTLDRLSALRSALAIFHGNRDADTAEAVGRESEAMLRAMDDVVAALDKTPHAREAAEAASLAHTYSKQIEANIDPGLAMNRLTEGDMVRWGETITRASGDLSQSIASETEALAHSNTAANASARRTSLALSAAAIVLSALFAWLTAGSIVRPVRSLTATMRKLSEGDTTVAIDGLNSKDELGEMARSVQVFKDNAIAKQKMEAEQAAAGQQTAAERKQAMMDLASKFEADVKGMVDTLATSATEMQATSQSMSATAEETSLQAVAVAVASA